MAQTAQGAAQIAGNGPHIAALAANHLQIDMVGIRAADHLQPLHPKGPRGQIHHLALARQIIGALAIHLHGGKLRRHLLDLAAKGGQGGVNLGICRAHRARFHHRALGIIGRGRRAQSHPEPIAFQRIGDIRHGLCRLAQGHGQNPGRRRVQRARMARLLRAKGPFHLVHHRGRPHARRLVHHQPAVHRPALFPARHISPVPWSDR